MAEAANQPLWVSLQQHLRGKQLLLVLDNFEHVIGAGPPAGELSATCPRLKLLVTSRACLHLREEREFPVPPLPVPESAVQARRGLGLQETAARTPEHLAAVASNASAALFVDRAQAVKPDFTITPENAAAVAEICRRLEGLPLAIELVAARIKLLPPQALLARLESPLKLPSAGARDMPTRHQTFQDAIAWSYDLLGEADARLFRRLAVFVVGFTLEAAEAVGSGSGSGPGPMATQDPESAVHDLDVLDGLASLVDRSLLVPQEGSPDVCFRMLEPIREFAWECLAGAPPARGPAAAAHLPRPPSAHRIVGVSLELNAVRRGHAGYYLKWAEAAAQKLAGAEQGEWLDRLERDHSNLRAVLEWSVESGEVDTGLRVAGLLGEFWIRRGHLTEGRRRLAELLRPGTREAGGESSRVSPEVRARALQSAGTLAAFQGDYGPARALLEESKAILEEGGPGTREAGEQSVPRLLTTLSMGAREQGDLVAACAYGEEGVEVARQAANPGLTAWALRDLGIVVQQQGDYDRAGILYEESLTLAREMGDDHSVAKSLTLLGEIAQFRGDTDAAYSLHHESLAIVRSLADKQCSAGVLNSLGNVAASQGDDGTACARYQESLVLRWELGQKRGIAECLERLADVAAARGQFDRAARLLGTATALRETIGAPLRPADRVGDDRLVILLRTRMGEDLFAATSAAGQATPLAEAVTEALEYGEEHSG